MEEDPQEITTKQKWFYIAHTIEGMVGYLTTFAVFAYLVHDPTNPIVCFSPPSKFVWFQSIPPLVLAFWFLESIAEAGMEFPKYDLGALFVHGVFMGIIGIILFLVLIFFAPLFVGF